MRRGLAVLALGGLGSLVGAVLAAPAANAAPVITIGEAAPAPVSVNPGDTVTFTNGLSTVGVTLLGVQVTASPNAILGGACGGTTLAPGASYSQAFSATASCPISFVYSVQGAVLSAVQAMLPPLPAPAQAVVNVIAQAVSNPPTGVPAPPTTPVAPPAATTTPAPPPPGGSSGGSGGGANGSSGGNGTTTVGSGTSPDGAQPGTAVGGAQQVQPAGQAAVPSLGASRSPGGYAPYESYLGSRTGSGAGTGSYDGASVPVFGQLAGLSGNRLSDAASSAPSAPDGALREASRQQLPIAAVAAVVALAGVTAALVRTHQVQRASR